MMRSGGGGTRVPKVVYEMAVSADGSIVGPDGKFDWSVPDEELHRFHNEQVRGLDAHLLGRRLYETMVYWEGEDPARGEVGHEFAAIWRALPKIRSEERRVGKECRSRWSPYH